MVQMDVRPPASVCPSIGYVSLSNIILADISVGLKWTMWDKTPAAGSMEQGSSNRLAQTRGNWPLIRLHHHQVQDVSLCVAPAAMSNRSSEPLNTSIVLPPH